MPPSTPCPATEAEAIRRQILKAFEAARETPGAPYDETQLLWHLVAVPAGAKGIHNTGRGKKHLGRFLRALESHYSICFSLKDWEHLVSLEQIQKRTACLLATPKSSLGSIRHMLNERPPDMLAFLLVFLCLPPVVLACKFLGIWGLGLLVLPVGLVWALYRWDRNRRNFYRAIEAQIKARRGGAAPASEGTSSGA